MAKCCGQERLTSFCPDCGKPLGNVDTVGLKLARHLHVNVWQWGRRVERCKEWLKTGNAGDIRLEHAESKLAEWSAWEKWVRDRLTSDSKPDSKATA